MSTPVEDDICSSLKIIFQKPSHFVYAILTFFGIITYYQVIVEAFNSDSKAFIPFIDNFALASVLFGSAIHTVHIYRSLIDCEDNTDFKSKFQPWLGEGNRYELAIRYFAFFALAVSSGKFFAELLFNDWQPIIIAIATFCIFGSFIIWSVVACLLCNDVKIKDVGIFLFCDLLAFFHWLFIFLFIVYGNEIFKMLVILLALFYLSRTTPFIRRTCARASVLGIL